MQGGDQSEEETGGHGDENREDENPPIQADQGAFLSDAGKVGGVYGEQRANSDQARRGTDHCAGQGQEHAFGEQLTNDAGAARSHGHADGHFAAASDGAGQQQVGHVGARNQQDESHGAHAARAATNARC